MDEMTALRLIDALSSGVHPLTGEILEEKHFCHDPRVVRALCLAARALEDRRHRVYRLRNLPNNTGKPWGKEETEILLAEFHAGKSQQEIAERLQRTPGSIQARLEKLGFLQPRMLNYE